MPALARRAPGSSTASPRPATSAACPRGRGGGWAPPRMTGDPGDGKRCCAGRGRARARDAAREDAVGRSARPAVRAGAAATRGDGGAALGFLARAESGLRAADMALHAAAARRRRGELIGGDAGRALVAESERLDGGPGDPEPRPDERAAGAGRLVAALNRDHRPLPRNLLIAS